MAVKRGSSVCKCNPFKDTVWSCSVNTIYRLNTVYHRIRIFHTLSVWSSSLWLCRLYWVSVIVKVNIGLLACLSVFQTVQFSSTLVLISLDLRRDFYWLACMCGESNAACCWVCDGVQLSGSLCVRLIVCIWIRFKQLVVNLVFGFFNTMYSVLKKYKSSCFVLTIDNVCVNVSMCRCVIAIKKHICTTKWNCHLLPV